jgi:WD40 repeat protein
MGSWDREGERGSGEKLVASGSGDKTVRLWDVTTGATVRTLEIFIHPTLVGMRLFYLLEFVISANEVVDQST